MPDCLGSLSDCPPLHNNVRFCSFLHRLFSTKFLIDGCNDDDDNDYQLCNPRFLHFYTSKDVKDPHNGTYVSSM